MATLQKLKSLRILKPLRALKQTTTRKINQLSGSEPRTRVQINCNKIELGSDYGGFFVCPEGITNDSIVYSFGLGKDISFDLEMIEKYNANVYGFDPTPESIDWLSSQSLPNKFVFFQYGLSNFDGIAKFYPPENPEYISHTILNRESTSNKAIEVEMHRLDTIIKKLHHSRIDVLKMDIEGAEYLVFDDIFNLKVPIKQILLEFHHNSIPGITAQHTESAVQKLNHHGYRIFSISPSGKEYSFIHIE